MFSVYDAVITQSDVSADKNNKGKGREKKEKKDVVKDDFSQKRRVF